MYSGMRLRKQHHLKAADVEQQSVLGREAFRGARRSGELASSKLGMSLALAAGFCPEPRQPELLCLVRLQAGTERLVGRLGAVAAGPARVATMPP